MREQREERAARLANLAGQQHGVVAYRQLTALGYDRGAIERLGKSGVLHRLHRAVYAVGHRPTTREASYMAAVLACGANAALSHWSAAAHWGLLGARAGAAVDVSAPNHRRRTAAIRTHWVPALERTLRNRIPVTTVPRTLLDLAPIASPKQLRRATNQAERNGWLNQRAVGELIDNHPRRAGIKAFTAVTAAVNAGTHRTRSDLEADFLALLERHRIERPKTNEEIDGIEVDFHWPGTKLIVELDSWEYHRTPTSFDDDRRKDAALKLLGYTVVRVSDAWLTTDPAGVAATIRQLLTT
jgi:very-short-patch-repair endonuclease